MRISFLQIWCMSPSLPSLQVYLYIYLLSRLGVGGFKGQTFWLLRLLDASWAKLILVRFIFHWLVNVVNLWIGHPAGHESYDCTSLSYGACATPLIYDICSLYLIQKNICSLSSRHEGGLFNFIHSQFLSIKLRLAPVSFFPKQISKNNKPSFKLLKEERKLVVKRCLMWTHIYIL